ncbi:MAG: Dabb family protein [Gemmatales bacterium]|nr:Dabb family protein [Gemmatales bacterium]
MYRWKSQVVTVGLAFLVGMGMSRLWPIFQQQVQREGLQAQQGQSHRWLVHNVYFSLKDNSPAARARLVEACHKYLSGHEGTIFFAAGVLAEDLNRPVNDRDFDVALHIVFKDKAAHDRYQEHPRHKQFIEENQAHWKKVRVLDSYAAPKSER